MEKVFKENSSVIEGALLMFFFLFFEMMETTLIKEFIHFILHGRDYSSVDEHV